MGKFQPEMTNPSGAPLVDGTTRFLRRGAQYCVAASHVGNHGVGAAGGVFELDTVFFAGAPAISITRSSRQKAAEHAVFGMKNRQVLIGYYLDALGIDFLG